MLLGVSALNSCTAERRGEERRERRYTERKSGVGWFVLRARAQQPGGDGVGREGVRLRLKRDKIQSVRPPGKTTSAPAAVPTPKWHFA